MPFCKKNIKSFRCEVRQICIDLLTASSTCIHLCLLIQDVYGFSSLHATLNFIFKEATTFFQEEIKEKKNCPVKTAKPSSFGGAGRPTHALGNSFTLEDETSLFGLETSLFTLEDEPSLPFIRSTISWPQNVAMEPKSGRCRQGMVFMFEIRGERKGRDVQCIHRFFSLLS